MKGPDTAEFPKSTVCREAVLNGRMTTQDSQVTRVSKAVRHQFNVSKNIWMVTL